MEELMEQLIERPMENRKKHAGIILGSYAACPPAEISSLVDAEQPDLAQAEFQRRVRNLAGVGGLELPFSRMGLLKNSGGLDAFEQLGFGWRLVVTFLPAQMENLELDPHFGLASERLESRMKACAEVHRLFDELQTLLKLRPDIELIGISLPTGPRVHGHGASCVNGGVTSGATNHVTNHVTSGERKIVSPSSSKAALRHSMRELQGCLYFEKINFEHCDSKRGASPVAKGFLELEDEIEIAKEFGLGLVVNWGRSAIEGRSAATPLTHLQKILTASAENKEPVSLHQNPLLRGLIFSGAASQHPIYGDWLDTHAPLREALDVDDIHESGHDDTHDDERALIPNSDHFQSGEKRSRLLLTLNEARACWKLVNGAAEMKGETSGTESRRQSGSGDTFKPFVGLKVQPLPRSLDVESRVKFLERHLEKLTAALLDIL